MNPVQVLDLNAYLSTRGRMIQAALDRYLPPPTQSPAVIHQAMRYSVFAGGKLLRPILVLAGCEACGGAPEPALPVACAVELIHTYSLIHDDLPAMDDADTRRGRPTCHVAFGEAIAVLAGDALHALAFSLLLSAAATYGAERTLAVAREIADAIGTDGMVGGQVLDLLGEGRTLPAGVSAEAARPADELVTEIHTRKTARLIRASVRAGAILTGADPVTQEALTGYGERLGLAYQILDDILDIEGEEATLGKRVGGDAARSKLTYPRVFGLPASRQAAARLTRDAVACLAPLGARGRILRALAEDLLERDR